VLVERPRDQRAHGACLPDVDPYGERLPAERSGDLARTALVEVAHDHGGAGLCEARAAGTTDPACSSGDDRDPAAETQQVGQRGV
jgi:hypothetical protein